MLVIGTAGHIDHGKSAIVKRITGTDPDRLPEEQARGMTIDLGFAFHQTANGDRIAFVDVPGHERFVRNMIAGAGGIDAVMLVVAADDGWMPQSEEHFQIVRLLGIKQGLIVINKCDLVDMDWLELLEEDIRDKVKGSFLAKSPIFRVSAQTGHGFEELLSYLDTLPATATSQQDIGKARLYIDRSFVLPGIGGVVTGTLRGGTLTEGQPVSVWPAIVTGKVRSLRANNQDVTTARPGQRTAVSLTGVDKELLIRGGVISDRLDLSFFAGHQVLALSVELLAEAPVSLSDHRHVLLITGTTEVEGEIRLAGRKEVKPSQRGIVYVKPEQPIYALTGDHFVLRLPTPMVTLGGGQILDHLEHVPRRKQASRYAYLEDRLSGGLEDMIVSELKKRVVLPADGLLSEAAVSAAQVRSAVKRMVSDGTLGMSEEFIFHNKSFNAAVDTLKKCFADHLKDKPHLKGLSREEALDLSPYDHKITDALLDYLTRNGSIIRLEDKYNLVGRDMSLKGSIKVAHDQLLAMLKAQPFSPPKLSKLAEGGKNSREAIKYIIESGEGYKCGSDFVFLSDAWTGIVSFITEQIGKAGKLSVGDLKDRFGLTRKFAIPILEETDRMKLTRRDGDFRVKGDKFENQESDP